MENPVNYAVAILLVAAALGCSNPKNTKIPRDLSQLQTIKPSLDKMTEEERAVFASYMMTRLMRKVPGTEGTGNPIPEGMTIGKAIEEQRAFLATLSPEQQQRIYRSNKPSAPQSK